MWIGLPSLLVFFDYEILKRALTLRYVRRRLVRFASTYGKAIE